jgi:hypothetical protein
MGKYLPKRRALLQIPRAFVVHQGVPQIQVEKFFPTNPPHQVLQAVVPHVRVR